MRYKVKIANKEQFQELMQNTGIDTPEAIINTGLSLLQWVTNQIRTGYSIMATLQREDTLLQRELRMQFIDHIRFMETSRSIHLGTQSRAEGATGVGAGG
jgi:hypothetical protein